MCGYRYREIGSGEALQDVRETSCASTAAHTGVGVLAGGPVTARRRARMRRANLDRSTGAVQSSAVVGRASALLSLRCVARQVDILTAACGAAGRGKDFHLADVSARGR